LCSAKQSPLIKQECVTRSCGCRYRHLFVGVVSSSYCTVPPPLVSVDDLVGRTPEQSLLRLMFSRHC
jgi:hypothetical protein